MGSVSDFVKSFWILGRVLDSGTRFGLWKLFLDSTSHRILVIA